MRILVAGDYCPLDRTQIALDQQDYSAMDAFIPIIAEVDYAIINLECPIVIDSTTNPIKKCGPNLKTTPNAIEVIKRAGFNCATLANNHFRDFGNEGCLKTIEVLQQYQIDYVGGDENLSKAQRVLYRTIANKTIGIINICENEFSIATEERAGSAPLDSIDNYHQILEAQTKADYVLLIVHGGHEMYQLPSPRMKRLYRHFIDLGVDAVVNHHQHCFSGYEFYRNKPIVYGLGNFCFDWNGKRNSIWNKGYAVTIDFSDENKSILLHPYKQCDTEAQIVIMDEEQRLQFEQQISLLNEIIQDDKRLQAYFKDWAGQQTKNVMGRFASYHNRYLNAAAYRGLLPWPIKTTECASIINYINCEAHRDIVLSVLNKKIN